MANELLKCLICPKASRFSDVSHLLTHVSSKGHLSHLHKLQVRSHQDSLSNQILSSYNLWYQQHGIPQLLSERLRQKEAKLANRRSVKFHSKQRMGQKASLRDFNPNVFENDIDVTAYGLSTPLTTTYSTTRDRRRRMQEELDDPSYVPIHRTGIADCFISSPLEQFSYPDPVSHTSIGLKPGRHSPRLQTPENTRLKGVIWPGMDIFDAATPEAQRKRNQKKPGSVLRHMQENSAAVEPMECVYSPGGTLKRKKHVDDLENDEDFVLGEFPMSKPSTRRGRKPTNHVSSRTSVRKQKVLQSQPTSSKASPMMFSTRSQLFRSNPNLNESPEAGFALNRSPSLRRAGKVRLRRRRAKPGFSVYADDKRVTSSSPTVSSFLPKRNGMHASTSEPQLQQVPYLQPQAHLNYSYDPLKLYHETHAPDSFRQATNDDKENVNPLFWTNGLLESSAIPMMPVTYDGFNDFDIEFSPLKEFFAFTRNPLHAGSPMLEAQN